MLQQGENGMYFAEPGRKNTAETVACALRAARERGIRNIVAASGTGATAMALAGFDGNLVCVTSVNGFSEKGRNDLPDEVRARLQAAGVKVLTGTHALSGVERGISNMSGGMYPAEIMAHTLRMFGQGTKVCVEIAVMALDAGLVPYGEEIVAVGGTGRGADTALLLTPAHAADIFKFRIHEVLCKPR